MSQTQIRSSGAKLVKLAAAFGLVAGLTLVSSASFAQDCSISAWNGSNTSATASNAVQGTRYKGKCGLVVDAASGDFVEHTESFDNEASVKSLFYLLSRNAQTSAGNAVTVYRMVDTSNNTLLEVSLQGSNLVMSVGGSSASAAVGNGWNSVVVEAGTSGNASMIVNGGSPATISGGTLSAAVGGVQLGSVASSGAPTGSLAFDYFVANRTDRPDLLANCNANNDGAGDVNSGDIVAILGEFLGGNLSEGTPDCNGDGAVNSGDIVAILGVFLS